MMNDGGAREGRFFSACGAALAAVSAGEDRSERARDWRGSDARAAGADSLFPVDFRAGLRARTWFDYPLGVWYKSHWSDLRHRVTKTAFDADEDSNC